MWATSLLVAALTLTAKVSLPQSQSVPEEEDIQWSPDTRSYTIHLGDQDLESDEPPEEHVPGANEEEFTRQEAWRMTLRQYVAVGEICRPPGSVRQIHEVTGLHQYQQKILRTVLETAAEGQPIWDVPKAQRRAWIASATFPEGLPPLPARRGSKNPPAPLSDTPLEDSEGV